MEDLRGLINRLQGEGELLRIQREVDTRYIPALVSQSDKALYFEKVAGFNFRVVSGLLNTRRRIAISLDAVEAELAKKIQEAIDHPVDPEWVKNAPVQEIVYTGEEVDLSILPIPLLHEKDGGPYISGGLSCSFDPEYGPNVGIYRLMLRTKNETGIGLATSSDLRLYYQRALEKGRPLEVAVVIGVHPFEMLAASYKAPPQVNEFAIAGGLRRESVKLVKCITNNVFVPADAEIVLEGEIPPVGWAYDEGRFGELNRIQSNISWNPIIKVKAITHRKDPIYYSLHMPWENGWLVGPLIEATALRVLHEAGIETSAVRVTPGGCFHFEIVASIRKRPGQGKNALLALLSLMPVKLAIVTDDDIDIYDPNDLEWALALRMQPDRDIIIVSGASGTGSDPSSTALPETEEGSTITSKLGIDATIPEGVPRERYERPRCSFKDDVKLGDYL